MFSDEDFARWAKSPRFSVLELSKGTMIAFKVPMQSRYEARFSEASVFTVSMFVERMAAKKKRLGVAIDATACDAVFHKRQDWDDWDVPLRTFEARGAPVVVDRCPSNADIDAALDMCRETWPRTVAVFSVDGFNTAGCVVVAALVECDKLTLVDALAKFAQARPPGVFKPRHLEFLKRRYGVDNLTVPEPPSYYDLPDDEPPEPEPKRPKKLAQVRDLSVIAPETGAPALLGRLSTTNALDLPISFVSSGVYEKKLDDIVNLKPLHLFRFEGDDRQLRKLNDFLAYLTARRKAAVLATSPLWYLEPQPPIQPNADLRLRS